MGKRKSGRAAAIDYNEDNTPGSDSDGSDKLPPKKKTKAESSSKSSSRTSEELAVSFGLNHVELEWTEADYQNLTNYGLFVRMVRPQVQGANPSINAGKLAQIMEAYWREFREGNPLTKKKEEEKKKEKPQKKKVLEEESKEHVIDSEPDLDDEDEEEPMSEVEEEERVAEGSSGMEEMKPEMAVEEMELGPEEELGTPRSDDGGPRRRWVSSTL